MRTTLLALCTALALAGFGWLAIPSALAQTAPAAPPTYKNLKVLPADISKDDLKAVMKAQAAALGVDCDHCHDTDDFSEDTDTKKTARGMMQMVVDTNKNYFGGKQVITCMTCHDGQEKPANLGPDADK
jgi:hypothetical protein